MANVMAVDPDHALRLMANLEKMVKTDKLSRYLKTLPNTTAYNEKWESDRRGIPSTVNPQSVYAKQYKGAQERAKMLDQGGHIFLKKPLLANPGPVCLNADFVITPLINEYGELPLHIRYPKPKNIPVPKKLSEPPEDQPDEIDANAITNGGTDDALKPSMETADETMPTNEVVDHELLGKIDDSLAVKSELFEAEAPMDESFAEQVVESVPETSLLPEIQPEIPELDELPDEMSSDAMDIQYENICNEPTTSSPSADVLTDSLFDSDRIGCVCRIAVENEMMLQCEKCFIWQHAICVGARPNDKSYFCYTCMPRRKPRVPLKVQEKVWTDLKGMIAKDMEDRSLYAIERICRLQKFSRDFDCENAIGEYINSIRSSK